MRKWEFLRHFVDVLRMNKDATAYMTILKDTPCVLESKTGRIIVID